MSQCKLPHHGHGRLLDQNKHSLSSPPYSHYCCPVRVKIVFQMVGKLLVITSIVVGKVLRAANRFTVVFLVSKQI